MNWHLPRELPEGFRVVASWAATPYGWGESMPGMIWADEQCRYLQLRFGAGRPDFRVGDGTRVGRWIITENVLNQCLNSILTGSGRWLRYFAYTADGFLWFDAACLPRPEAHAIAKSIVM